LVSFLKVIVGYVGKHILFELRRINHRLEDVKKPIANEKGDTSIFLRTVSVYYKRKIWVTTSGYLLVAALKLVVDKIGADRVLFRAEYLYETIENVYP
jgi:2,3-dihydroxybenzoate decarboxylase